MHNHIHIIIITVTSAVLLILFTYSVLQVVTFLGALGLSYSGAVLLYAAIERPVRSLLWAVMVDMHRRRNSSPRNLKFSSTLMFTQPPAFPPSPGHLSTPLLIWSIWYRCTQFTIYIWYLFKCTLFLYNIYLHSFYLNKCCKSWNIESWKLGPHYVRYHHVSRKSLEDVLILV